MPAELKDTLRAWLRRPLAQAALLITGLVLVVHFGRLGNLYLSGEEFYVLHDAHNQPFFLAWAYYFVNNGRPVEALYWTGLYKLVGFNPRLLHSFSLLLLGTASLLASAWVGRVLPVKYRRHLVWLALLFFFNWISLEMVLRLSTDNSRLALICFFAAGIAWQSWAASQLTRKRYFLLGAGLLAVGVLAYENIALLGPTLLLMAWPLLDEAPPAETRRRLRLFIIIGALSLLIVLLPVLLVEALGWLRGLSVAHPATQGALASGLGEMLRSVFAVWLDWGQVGALDPAPLHWLPVVLVLAALLGSSWLLWRPGPEKTPERSRLRVIHLAAVWIIFMGPLPYALAGYSDVVRIYSSAIFGLPILLLVFFVSSPRRLPRLAVMLLALTLVAAGIYQFHVRNSGLREAEIIENNFYYGLKHIVPDVEPDTIFVIIDLQLSNSGCGPSMAVLYSATGMRCVFLSSTNPNYHAERYADYAISNRGGRIQGGDWLLIYVDEQGHPRLLDQIGPGDLDLIIEWVSPEPLYTNYGLLDTGRPMPESAFYQSILERRRELGLPVID